MVSVSLSVTGSPGVALLCYQLLILCNDSFQLRHQLFIFRGLYLRKYIAQVIFQQLKQAAIFLVYSVSKVSSASSAF
jgi:hypothetical protein